MQLDKKLYEEINEYCKLNNLKTRDFIHNLLKEAFMKEKFGETPFSFNKKKSEMVIKIKSQNIETSDVNKEKDIKISEDGCNNFTKENSNALVLIPKKKRTLK